MPRCEVCGTEVAQGRGRARRTCSAACRQKAHRQRQAGQLAELRAGLTLVPPPASDDSPAGRIRAASAALAAAAEHAATAAEENAYRDDSLSTLRRRYVELVDAVRAAMPPREPSRDEPEPHPVPAPVTPETPAAEPSRDEPAVKAAAPKRRKRMTEKAARAVADTAQLVKDPDHRDNHRWNLVAEDGTTLGHVVPSYGGTGRTGRNGWRYEAAGTFIGNGPYKTRDEAAVQCALSWMRSATAPARRD